MTGFDWEVIRRSLGYLFLDGMVFTLTLTALAATGGVVLGTALALLRLAGGPVLAAFAAGYVNLMRSLPLVLVIFWFYFLAPYLGQWITGAFASSLLTFTLFEAAYFSEIIRAGMAPSRAARSRPARRSG